MKKTRMLAFVLALLMCMTVLPAGALAADTGEELVSNAPVTDGNYVFEPQSGKAIITKYTGTAASVTIPATLTDGSATYNVTTIGAYAFEGNTTMTSLTLPAGVTTLRGGAFSGCTALTKVTIKGTLNDCDADVSPFDGAGSDMAVTFASDVTKIPANLFKSPDGSPNVHIKSVTIPATVTRIGKNAFRNCTGLTSVSWGSGITSIGDGAFYGCTGLTSVTLSKVSTLGNEAFAYCENLKTLTINHNLKDFGADNTVFWKAGSAASGITVTFGTGVSYVPNYLFYVDSPNTANSPKVTKIIFQGKAPSFGIDPFKGITATAYYPSAEAESWTPMCLPYGGTITWKVGEKPAIKTQPTAVSAKVNTKVTFKVAATGTDLKYQWQIKNGSKWEDITGSPYTGYKKATLTVTATAALDGKEYRCVVSNDLGSKTSTAVKLTIMVKPTISTQPADATVNEDNTVTFKVKATGGNLKYQWYYQEYGTTIWTKIKGATKSSYSFKATRDLRRSSYRCRVYNEAGSKYSDSAKLTIKLKPRITTQPTNKTVVAGKTVTFKVKASGSGLKYQWYVKKAGTTKWTAVAFENSASLTLTATKGMNGNYYRCRVYNDAGRVNTNAVKLTVTKK